MTRLIDLWLEAAHEAHALRAQVGHLEEAWLRAEADADYWYFQACNRPARTVLHAVDAHPSEDPEGAKQLRE